MIYHILYAIVEINDDYINVINRNKRIFKEKKKHGKIQYSLHGYIIQKIWYIYIYFLNNNHQILLFLIDIKLQLYVWNTNQTILRNVLSVWKIIVVTKKKKMFIPILYNTNKKSSIYIIS